MHDTCRNSIDCKTSSCCHWHRPSSAAEHLYSLQSSRLSDEKNGWRSLLKIKKRSRDTCLQKPDQLERCLKWYLQVLKGGTRIKCTTANLAEVYNRRNVPLSVQEQGVSSQAVIHTLCNEIWNIISAVCLGETIDRWQRTEGCYDALKPFYKTCCMYLKDVSPLRAISLLFIPVSTDTAPSFYITFLWPMA